MQQRACLANDVCVVRTLTDCDLTTTVPKTKKLTIRELRNVVKELKNVDLSVVQEVVVRGVCKRSSRFTFSEACTLSVLDSPPT